LLAGDRKGRAGKSTGKKVDAVEGLAVNGPDVGFENVPFRTVVTERSAAVLVDLDQAHMIKARVIEAKGLSPGTGADFQRRQFGHHILRPEEHILCADRFNPQQPES
jgi:hypothetical protein